MPELRDEEYMREAVARAEEALQAGEVPVGAVVVHGGRVIAAARNEREGSRDPTAHAEILAMRRAAEVLGDWRLRGCTLYVTLEPCPMCAGAMVMSQLERCVFGAYDPRRGCCGSVYDLPGDPRLQGQTSWRAGVLDEEGKRLMDAFFGAARGSGDDGPAAQRPGGE